MFKFLANRLINRSFNNANRKNARKHTLGILSMDDRIVPAIFTITSPDDSGPGTLRVGEKGDIHI